VRQAAIADTKRMKFLLDTNVLIPVEPGSLTDVEPSTAIIAEFVKLCNEAKQQLYVHPLIMKDIERDKDDDRRQLRKLLVCKYLELHHAPGLDKIEPVVGIAAAGSNDWVDNHLLAAVFGNAAHATRLRSRIMPSCRRLLISAPEFSTKS
jgi:hypothetical protein